MSWQPISSQDEWDQDIAERFAKVRYAMFMQKPEDKELLQDALKAFDKWGAFNPNRRGICSAKAVMHYTAGQFKEAKEQAFRELNVSPADPSALTILGRLSLREGNVSEARAYFEAALRSDPEYEKAAEGLRACGQ